jgi:spore germination cell wall hydrolase CwlJ-like protein
VLQVRGDLRVDRQLALLLADVELGPDALAVPVVQGQRDRAAAGDRQLAVPAAPHLEDLVLLAQQQEPEAGLVPHAGQVAVVVDPVVVAVRVERLGHAVAG